MPKLKVLFGGVFVILAFLVMFTDALVHLDQESKISMVLVHAGHAMHGDHVGDGHEDTHTDEGDTHEETAAAISMEMVNALPKMGPKTKKLAFNEVEGVKEFEFSVDDIMWEYAEGKYVHAWAYNGQVPGPEIRVNEGDRVRVKVKNNLPVPTSVHWHGVDVENKADGVPGLTQYAIMPGESYVYEFTAIPAGTRFYHSHGSGHDDSVVQMDMGLSGAFIIEPKDTSDARHSSNYDREYVYFLDDWIINDDGSNGALSGISTEGGHDHSEHAGSGPGYNIFTVNGRVYPDVPALFVEENDKVLIRLISASSQEIHPMHTHGHSFKVIAIDGNLLHESAQQTRDVITVNPAERYDIVLNANNPGAWLFHCHHLHHAAAGMVIPFYYSGYEPCCETEKTNYYSMLPYLKTGERTEHSDDGHGHGEDMEDSHGSGEHVDTPTFLYGPGETAHLHSVDPKKFQSIKEISVLPQDVPLPLNRNEAKTVEISLVTKEVVSELAPGITYNYWTFNGTIPGPFLRVREGDTIELSLSNDKSSFHNHSIDLHAVTGPGGGAVLTNVAPGETKSMKFKALNPGLYVYHCATPNVPMHMANGMYGLILVEPEEGLPDVDKEFYVMQGELYTVGSIGEKGFQMFSSDKMLLESPDYVVFNGRTNALVDNPMKADVGDKVRLYVGNGGVSLVSSFHVIGEIFDKVYPEGSIGSAPDENIQTTIVPAGGSTIVEFNLEYPGNFVLVDHALARLDRGAWGLLQVNGEKNRDIYDEIK